mmetsp:Transcript_75222/g.207531  ORF Transcript_75222/g.207531 Transcript_75222/m.207531 type:complete len:231 (-) Transcript_75222:425-1117(-)
MHNGLSASCGLGRRLWAHFCFHILCRRRPRARCRKRPGHCWRNVMPLCCGCCYPRCGNRLRCRISGLDSRVGGCNLWCHRPWNHLWCWLGCRRTVCAELSGNLRWCLSVCKQIWRRRSCFLRLLRGTPLSGLIPLHKARSERGNLCRWGCDIRKVISLHGGCCIAEIRAAGIVVLGAGFLPPLFRCLLRLFSQSPFPGLIFPLLKCCASHPSDFQHMACARCASKKLESM